VLRAAQPAEYCSDYGSEDNAEQHNKDDGKCIFHDLDSFPFVSCLTAAGRSVFSAGWKRAAGYRDKTDAENTLRMEEDCPPHREPATGLAT